METTYDIFRSDPQGPVWIESVTGLAEVREHLTRLFKMYAAEYFAYDIVGTRIVARLPNEARSIRCLIAYASGEMAVSGDRIKDKKGASGTVIQPRPDPKNPDFGELTIKWDEGAVEMRYPRAKDFILVSRALLT